jgi:branched-chain amino acid transport system ATP-binding protein
MLQVESLTTHYGNIRALDNVSLTVGNNEIVTLIGPNGAGKTTLLKTISGLLKPSNGSIRYLNNPITEFPPEKIARNGIAHVPEGRHVFPELTVKDNLLMGAFTRKNPAQIREDLQSVYDMFPVLKERRSQNAGSLSGGIYSSKNHTFNIEDTFLVTENGIELFSKALPTLYY